VTREQKNLYDLVASAPSLAAHLTEALDQIDKLPGIDRAIKLVRHVRDCLGEEVHVYDTVYTPPTECPLCGGKTLMATSGDERFWPQHGCEACSRWIEPLRARQ
jgi:hypothetical protein